MVENVEKRVRKIIGVNCDVEKVSEIGLTEKLQDLGINSVSFIKLILALEKEFGIESNDEDLSYEGFQTLQGIIDYIEKRV